MAQTNRLNKRMAFGSGNCAHLSYCGSYVGSGALPGSDGYCGPNNGPQCEACKGYGRAYCGKFIGKSALPGSDGYCGPNNGPQCINCKGKASAPMMWGLFTIGSAGHARGAAKTKADHGMLSTVEDIKDCEDYILSYNNVDVSAYTSYMVKGRGGFAGHCLAELTSFFKECKKRNLGPIIYYTGHGDKSGNWCFPDRDLTPKEVMDARSAHCSRKAILFNDCCYSGEWIYAAFRNGSSSEWLVHCASDQNHTAQDRWFARAVFKKDSTVEQNLQDTCKAITMPTYGANPKFWRGQMCGQILPKFWLADLKTWRKGFVNLKCPAGHKLQRYLTPGGKCDRCSIKCPAKTEVMDCRNCNYYLCLSCSSSEA